MCALLGMGFTKSRTNASLFNKFTTSYTIYLLINVDDIIIIGDNDIEVKHLISVLNDQFSRKYLGSISYFLGIEVTILSNGDLMLNHCKYIKKLLLGDNIDQCKPIYTPMSMNFTLFAHVDEPCGNPSFHRSFVGVLNDQFYTLLISVLNDQFSLKYLGPLSYFLGIEVTTLSNGDLMLNQCKYIRELLFKVNMDQCKPISTLMSTNFTFFAHVSEPLEIHPFIGVSWVSCNILQSYDLISSFVVHKVRYFMTNLLLPHWTAVKRILKYLCSTLNFDFVLKLSSQF